MDLSVKRLIKEMKESKEERQEDIDLLNSLYVKYSKREEEKEKNKIIPCQRCCVPLTIHNKKEWNQQGKRVDHIENSYKYKYYCDFCFDITQKRSQMLFTPNRHSSGQF